MCNSEFFIVTIFILTIITILLFEFGLFMDNSKVWATIFIILGFLYLIVTVANVKVSGGLQMKVDWKEMQNALDRFEITEDLEKGRVSAINEINRCMNPEFNPYWDNICKLADKQRQKGIDTYGQGLEANTKPNFEERIEYIEEELIDALMYLEWLKDGRKSND